MSLAGFILPTESGEKISLRKFLFLKCFHFIKSFIKLNFFIIKLIQKEITNLLAVVFFGQYLSETVPKSSLGIPIMSKMS